MKWVTPEPDPDVPVIMVKDDPLVTGTRLPPTTARRIDVVTGRTSLPRPLSFGPSIVIHSSPTDLMYPAAGVPRSPDAGVYVSEAWFKNSPMVRDERAVARGVIAEIAYRQAGEAADRFSIYGKWADATALHHAAYRRLLDRVDMEPNDEPHKLLIALKYPDDSVCYAFRDPIPGAKARVVGQPIKKARWPELELPIGRYDVRVRLTGRGVEREFTFLLENGGPGKPISLNPAQQ